MYVPQTRVLGIISGYQVELGTSVNRVPCTPADSLYVYLMTTEIVLVNPHPLRPTAPRSHMYTGVSVITTQPVILCLRCPTGPFPVSPVPALAGEVVHRYRL
jgi:hypothetical protein